MKDLTEPGLAPASSVPRYHPVGKECELFELFLLFTAADASETPVPGAAYTFRTLKHAQALGDFDALVANRRHVVHFHISDPNADFSSALEALVDGSFEQREPLS